MKKIVIIGLWLFIALGVFCAAMQEKPTDPPTLKAEDKVTVLQLQRDLAQFQSAMMKAEMDYRAAQSAYQDGSTKMTDLMKKLEKPGYRLNADTLTYIKVPDEKK